MFAGGELQEEVTDSTFMRGLCGNHKLTFSEGMVHGLIYPGVEQATYADFVADLELCLDFTSGTGRPGQDEIAIALAPNPTTEQFRLESLNALVTEVQVYSAAGQQMLQMKIYNQPETTVVTDRFPPGVYLVQISFTDGRSTVRRVVIAP